MPTEQEIGEMLDIPADWLGFIMDAARKELEKVLFVLKDEAWNPPPRLTLEWARHCALSDARVVLIGQDPYPEGATGLAFSVECGAKIPPSLANIARCLGVVNPLHGNLTQWARQGIILLNTALTLGHFKEWSPFVSAVYDALVARGCYTIALGGKAQKMAEDRPRVFAWSHPSPLNRDSANFINCDCFVKVAGEIFATTGRVINWDWTAAKSPADVARWWIFTDGGSLNNGKKNCRAAYAYVVKDAAGIVPDARFAAHVVGKQSNNCGELMAIREGLKAAKEIIAAQPVGVATAQSTSPPNKNNSAICVSDSDYSIKSITRWFHNWSPQDGKKNYELIGECVALKWPKLAFQHTRSHTKRPAESGLPAWIWDGNDECDRLCTEVLKSTTLPQN